MFSTASLSSTFCSQVAGQPLHSLETLYPSRKSSANSCSPLSPFSSNSWDIRDHENVCLFEVQFIHILDFPIPQICDSDEDWESSSCSSGAETMIWDSPPPSSSGLPEPLLNSVLEDWNYDPLPSPIPTIIIEEEDGAQTVVIDSQSPFFSPPLAGSSENEARFPLGLPLKSKTRRDGVPASAISPYSPFILESHPRFEPEQADLRIKDQMLFVITASLQGGFALSSPLFHSPQPIDEAEVTLWAKKGLTHGPDVPSDFIYPASDIFPTGNWDEVGYQSYHVFKVELTNLSSLVSVDALVSYTWCSL